tara:strand:- start:927 stop:1091 length:165 start_codon:yes stop_codon:yes gene_type:complete
MDQVQIGIKVMKKSIANYILLIAAAFAVSACKFVEEEWYNPSPGFFPEEEISIK